MASQKIKSKLHCYGERNYLLVGFENIRAKITKTGTNS